MAAMVPLRHHYKHLIYVGGDGPKALHMVSGQHLVPGAVCAASSQRGGLRSALEMLFIAMGVAIVGYLAGSWIATAL